LSYTSTLGAGATTQSLADYLVENMNPSQEDYRFKQAGIKFKQRFYSMFGTKGANDPILHMRDFGGGIADTIKLMPSWYSRDAFVSRLEKGTNKVLESDPKLAKAIRRVNQTARDSEPSSVESLAEGFEVIADFTEASYLSKVDSYSGMFLESDVPESCFSLMAEADRANCLRLRLMAARLHHLEREIALRRSRGFQAFKESVIKAQAELAPIGKSGKKLSEDSLRFEWYISFANANNLDEVFTDTPIKWAAIDKEYYSALQTSIEISLSTMHRTVSDLFHVDNRLRIDAADFVNFEISNVTKEFQSSIAPTLLVQA